MESLRELETSELDVFQCISTQTASSKLASYDICLPSGYMINKWFLIAYFCQSFDILGVCRTELGRYIYDPSGIPPALLPLLAVPAAPLSTTAHIVRILFTTSF